MILQEKYNNELRPMLLKLRTRFKEAKLTDLANFQLPSVEKVNDCDISIQKMNDTHPIFFNGHILDFGHGNAGGCCNSSALHIIVDERLKGSDSLFLGTFGHEIQHFIDNNEEIPRLIFNILRQNLLIPEEERESRLGVTWDVFNEMKSWYEAKMRKEIIFHPETTDENGFELLHTLTYKLVGLPFTFSKNCIFVGDLEFTLLVMKNPEKRVWDVRVRTPSGGKKKKVKYKQLIFKYVNILHKPIPGGDFD